MKTTTSMAKIAGLLMVAGTATHAEELTISAWGGFFEETLAAEIYPGFTAETGIEVRSIAQPEDSTWMTQLMAANRAGQAPADLSLVVDEVLYRGNEVGLWAELDPANMAGTEALIDGYVKLNDAGNAYAVGALAFYTTFVTNTDYAADAPASWAELWEPQWDGKLGIVTTPNSGLIEVTAKTFFGGYEIMETREGLEEVIAKIAELKPQVSLWYRDEGQFQQSLESGELNAGLYYHDVTMLSIWDGLPVASTFPTEGGIVSDAYWVVPAASENIASAEQFLDYMSRPEVQAQMALTMGVAPIVPRDSLDLSDEDFAAVSSDIEPIRVQTHIHLREGDWLETKYQEMIAQ
ncbi:extracellular solute-binding protein [Octadecabacter sp. CECT 8868]|uniref:ABC transporter substrate-binding protein n=1 Tax=Octadecabacter algicola TaxID=2909342 RepID=UPI001F32B621|nr:extracellular solute-binding protein [Octadecabacter algicola]MCF2904990.1 extracellular solute-binding protein [Octadecabacter algicola]